MNNALIAIIDGKATLNGASYTVIESRHDAVGVDGVQTLRFDNGVGLTVAEYENALCGPGKVVWMLIGGIDGMPEAIEVERLRTKVTV